MMKLVAAESLVAYHLFNHKYDEGERGSVARGMMIQYKYAEVKKELPCKMLKKMCALV